MDNQIIRNSLGEMLVNSAFDLENEFLKALAAGDGTEEILGGEVADRSQDPSMQETGIDPLQEGEDIASKLNEPDDEAIATKDWDNFSIDRSDNYAAKLQAPDQQGLDPKDANKKSFFIKYVDPDTQQIFGVMGPMFGINKEEGVGQSWVGGYETQTEAEEDFHKMKEAWDAFPEDRDYMLVELSELSPDLVAYEKQKQDELPEKVDEQELEADKADEEEVPEIEVPEIPEAPIAEEKPTSKTTPQPSLPKPVKKVPAFMMDIRLKRESRLQRLNTIKGN